MIEKPENIQKPNFNIIHGAGFAEEDVEAYLGELIPSYNRLMEAEWQGRVTVETLSGEKAVLEAEKRDLEEVVTNKDAEIVSLTAQKNEAEQINSQLNASLVGLREEVDTKTTAHDNIAAELSARNVELETSEERVRQLEADAEAVSGTETETAERLREANDRIRDLENQLAASEEAATVVPTLSIVDDSYAHADTQTDSINLEDTQFGTTDGIPAEAEENLSVVEKYNQYEAIINDTTAGHSDRASALLSRAYELGEEYIATSEREGNQVVETAREHANSIVDEANTYADESRTGAVEYSTMLRTGADQYATRVRTEADDEALEILAKAEHEAAFVGDSVKELRSERDDILTKLRDYFQDSIKTVEEIGTLPEYDPESFLLKEEGDPALGARNEALEEAEAAYRAFEENKSDTAGDAEDAVDFNNLDTPVEANYDAYDVSLVLPEETTQETPEEAVESNTEDAGTPADVVEHVETPTEAQPQFSDVEENENVLENTEPTHTENPFFGEEKVDLPEEGADSTGFSEELNTGSVETNSEVQPDDTQQYRSFSSLIQEPQASETEEEPSKKKRSFRDFLKK